MFRKIIAKYLLGGLFLLFVLSDFISKAGMHYNNPLIHTSQIVKGLFEFLAVVYIIKNVSFKDRFLYIGVVLLIFFQIGRASCRERVYILVGGGSLTSIRV